MRVFVVDDEHELAALLTDLLERAPEARQVQTFTHPTAALEAIVRDRPDVVLTDFRMPGLDGIQLAIRGRRVSPETRFILMTAYADSALSKRSAAEPAVWRFLPKPFGDEELLAVLAEAATDAAAA